MHLSEILYCILESNIHLSNVLTDHFLNSLPEKTNKGIPMKFSQCPFKNIFFRLPLSNCDIYLQIIHVRQTAIFTFTARASRVLAISHFKLDILHVGKPPHQKNKKYCAIYNQVVQCTVLNNGCLNSFNRKRHSCL